MDEEKEKAMAEENKNLENEELENEDVEDQNNESGKDDKTGSDDKGTKKESNKDDKGGKSGVKTFTQEQVTKMMTKEKNQGRMAALKELGIDPKDTKAVNMVKALIESQKTEEEKAAEKKSAEEAKIIEANQRAAVAEAKAEAMLLGVKTQYVEDVVALATTKMTEDSDLKTIIGEFKTKYPMWFGEDSEDDKDDKKGKTGQKGTGSSVKTNKNDKAGDDKKGLGARLAAQRKSSTKKSSYWGNK